MKTLHLNPIKAALFCVLFSLLQSCTPAMPGSWKNEKISSGKRDDFHKLNTEALRYLKANDPKGLNALLSKEMIAGRNEPQVELISNRLTDNEYELLDEYYVVHKYKDTDTVRTIGADVNRYAILYPYTARQMYLAYFVPKKSDNKYMISLVYGKFDYGWKIIEMGLAPYTVNGKTAPELYAIAKEQYAKKELQAALNSVSLAQVCFKPGLYWQYPDALDAGNFYVRVNQEVTDMYHYPLVLRQIDTGPMILRVYTANTSAGTFPMIYYMTHFELKDTTEVKNENLKVRNVVAKIMPGLKDNNKRILYSAFNKQPTGYNEVEHFDMTDNSR